MGLPRKILHILERPWDAVKNRVKRRFQLYRPLQIVPYRGFGNGRFMDLQGRVMEHREIGDATHQDPWWKNAKAMVHRFTADEVPNMLVRGSVCGTVAEDITDGDGYFHLRFHVPASQPLDQVWYTVNLELLTPVAAHDYRFTSGEILVPPNSAEFGVISDIDDTILQSSATDFWRLAWLTFANNAYTRTPFAGVADLYQALQQGTRGVGPNPIFYVSSSAWNIYDLLEQFMALNKIPRGPILLQDLRIDRKRFLKSRHDHKLEKIERIMDYYPELPFILIGDSGQQDPWLYREVVRRQPGRIAAIYIRDVRESRRDRVGEIIAGLSSEKVPMLLVEDASGAARHAYESGFISHEGLVRVGTHDTVRSRAVDPPPATISR
jgi:phosphatidate phosphatase APP1